MFDNIGGKIKTLAQVVCWIGIICSVIFGFIFGAEADSFLVGLLIIVLGSLTAWTSSFTLYGFGELIENSEIANSNTYEIHKLLTRIAPEEKKEPVKETKTSYFSSVATSTVKRTPNGGWICKKCGTKNDSSAQFCKDCGTYK